MRMMNWNVQAGGFAGYDPQLEEPDREWAIQGVVQDIREDGGLDCATLTDAYRWDEVYGGEAGIARHLGFQTARFVRLGDARLEADNGAGIGIAFATDETIARSDTLDLGTRQALGVILDTGRHGLQIANVYLDDLSEDRRARQASALVAELQPDVPTVLVGDFNTLRDETTGMALRHRLGDLAVRTLATVIPRSHPLGQSISGMNERRVIPQLRAAGYRDGDPAKQPTAPAYAPMFGIDYVLHNDGVQVRNLRRLSRQQTGRASDHLPFVFDVRAV